MTTQEIKTQFESRITPGTNPIMVLEDVLTANGFMKARFLEEGTWLTPEEATEWKAYKDSTRYSDCDTLLGIERPKLDRPELKGFSIAELYKAITNPEVAPSIEDVKKEISYSRVDSTSDRSKEDEQAHLLKFALSNLKCKPVASEFRGWFGGSLYRNEAWIWADMWAVPSECKKVGEFHDLEYSLDEDVALALEKPAIAMFSFSDLKNKIFL